MAEVKQDYLVYIPGLTYYSKGPLWVDAMKLEASISGNGCIPTYINAGLIDLGALLEGEYAFNNNSSSAPSGRKSPADILDIELAQMYEEDGRIALYSTPYDNVGAFYDYVEQMTDDSEFPGEYRHILTHKEYTEDSQLSSENAEKYASCKNLDLKHHDGIYLIKIDNLNTDIYLKFTFYSKVRSELQNNKITFGVEGSKISDGTCDSIADLITNEYVEVGTFESVYNPLTSGLKKINWQLPANLLDMYYDKKAYDENPAEPWYVPAKGDFLAGLMENGVLKNDKGITILDINNQSFKDDLIAYYRYIFDVLGTRAEAWFDLTESHSVKLLGGEKDRLFTNAAYEDDDFSVHFDASFLRLATVNFNFTDANTLGFSLYNTYVNLDDFNYLYRNKPKFNIVNFLDLDLPSCECFIPMLCMREHRATWGLTQTLLPDYEPVPAGTGAYRESYNSSNPKVLTNALLSAEPILMPNNSAYEKNSFEFWVCGNEVENAHERIGICYWETSYSNSWESFLNLASRNSSSIQLTLILNDLKLTTLTSKESQYFSYAREFYKQDPEDLNTLWQSAKIIAKTQLGEKLTDKKLPITQRTGKKNNAASILTSARGAGTYIKMGNLPSSTFLQSGNSILMEGNLSSIKFQGLVNPLVLKFADGYNPLHYHWSYAEQGSCGRGKARYTSGFILTSAGLINQLFKIDNSIDETHLGVGYPVINVAPTWYIDVDNSQLSYLYKGDYAIAPMLTLPGVGYLYSGKSATQLPVNIIYKNYITGWELPAEGLITKDDTDKMFTNIDSSEWKSVDELGDELGGYHTSFIFQGSDSSTTYDIKYLSSGVLNQGTTISVTNLETGLYVLKLSATKHLNADINFGESSGTLSYNKALIHIASDGQYNLTITTPPDSDREYISGIGLYKVDLNGQDINTQSLNSWYKEWIDKNPDTARVTHIFDTANEDLLLRVIFPSVVCAKEDISFCPVVDYSERSSHTKPHPDDDSPDWQDNTYYDPTYGYKVIRRGESPNYTYEVEYPGLETYLKSFNCYYLPDNPIYQIEGFYKVPNDLKLNDKSFETIYTEGKKIIGADGGESTLVYSLDKDILDGVLVKFLN